MDIEKLAEVVATSAHGATGQLRKYTFEPYIVHPRAVVEIVKSIPNSTPEMRAAAWLHDVVEDTSLTLKHIKKWFGVEVRDMVAGLTNVQNSEGNRALRFEMNLERLKNSSNKVKTIKVADLIDNTKTITEYDPKFSTIYLAEKRRLLDEALRGADQELWALAWRQINGSKSI